MTAFSYTCHHSNDIHLTKDPSQFLPVIQVTPVPLAMIRLSLSVSASHASHNIDSLIIFFWLRIKFTDRWRVTPYTCHFSHNIPTLLITNPSQFQQVTPVTAVTVPLDLDPSQFQLVTPVTRLMTLRFQKKITAAQTPFSLSQSHQSLHL